MSNYSNKVKWKFIKKNIKSEDFYTHDLHWENVIFWVAPPGHTIAYKNIDNLSKMSLFAM